MSKSVRRAVCALGVTLVALTTPMVAAAYDGEVGDMNDTDSITDVYKSGGRATVSIDYVHDCPGGLSDCWIEVQFQSRCPEVWCGWTAQNWRRLPPGGVVQANCMGSGNEDNEWRVLYRVGYAAPAARRVEFWGEVEFLLTVSGAGAYRNAAESLVNLTSGTGVRGGTELYEVFAQAAYFPSGGIEVATSAGRDIVTC